MIDATQAIVAVGAFGFLMGLMTGVGLWASHRLGNWTSAAIRRLTTSKEGSDGAS